MVEGEEAGEGVRKHSRTRAQRPCVRGRRTAPRRHPRLSSERSRPRLPGIEVKVLSKLRSAFVALPTLNNTNYKRLQFFAECRVVQLCIYFAMYLPLSPPGPSQTRSALWAPRSVVPGLCMRRGRTHGVPQGADTRGAAGREGRRQARSGSECVRTHRHPLRLEAAESPRRSVRGLAGSGLLGWFSRDWAIGIPPPLTHSSSPPHMSSPPSPLRSAALT